jgi:hypothetical protein
MNLVGYFFALCGAGEDGTLRPAVLGTTRWEKAYSLFYDRLGEGRTPDTFQHSLQNMRDALDAHLSNGLRGWFKDGDPAPLSRSRQAIFDDWESRDCQEVWNEVQKYLNRAVLVHEYPHQTLPLRARFGG